MSRMYLNSVYFYFTDFQFLREALEHKPRDGGGTSVVDSIPGKILVLHHNAPGYEKHFLYRF